MLWGGRWEGGSCLGTHVRIKDFKIKKKKLKNNNNNSYDHCIYCCGQESLIRNGGAFIVNRKVQNAVLGCNLKNNKMISVCFQGKPLNIIVIQVYAPITNAKEAEVEQFYDDLQDLLEITPKKDVLFIIGY
jgi:exonuclease III